MDKSSPTRKIFADRLRTARDHRHLNQAQLADSSGLQASAISHFETGGRMPSFENLRKLADALDVTIDFLLGRTNTFTGVTTADQLHRDIDNLTTEDQKLATDILEMLQKRSHAQRGPAD